MYKKIKNGVDFDLKAFSKSIHEYKEYIRRRYSESIEMDKRKHLQH
jgi:hypothetical protein